MKKELYPKTERIKCDGLTIQITEKLDGSNLVIFKLNNELYFAQRNNIVKIDELEENKNLLYNGLYQWLLNNKDILQEELHDRSAICGEWLGMGQIKYSIDNFDKRYYMFAKANINDDMELIDIKYDHKLFIYPFNSQIIPNFIGVVPVVYETKVLPNKNYLDSIYDKYTKKVNRKVEGFVINYENNIKKYVRMKNGKVIEYSDNDHKGI